VSVIASHIIINRFSYRLYALLDPFFLCCVLGNLISVSSQGEVIDRIEHNVESAAHHVHRGTEQVRKASKLKKSINKVSDHCML